MRRSHHERLSLQQDDVNRGETVFIRNQGLSYLKAVLWTRETYRSASAFLALTLVAAVFDRVVQAWLGMDFVVERGWLTRSSLRNWLIVENIISIAGTLFLLGYYRHKRYWASFWAAIIAASASISVAILICLWLSMYREYQSLYGVLRFGYLVANLLLSISLIFSKAGGRPLLKWAGILIGVAAIIALSSNLHLKNSGLLKTETFEKLHATVAWVVIVVPLLFILNFSDESKRTDCKGENSPQTWFSKNGLNISILACIALMVAQGYDLLIVLKRGEQKEISQNALMAARPFLAKSFISKKGETLKYRLLLPVNYSSKKKYPLVVCLHHGGAHGNDNTIQVDGSDIAKFLSKTANRTKYPAFLFVPQCPQGKYWGDGPNGTNIDSLVFEAMASLEDNYSIDPRRRYVGGTSGGGFGTWFFISSQPGMFAAAIPMCSGGDARSAYKLTEMPIWAFHGTLDKMAPVQGTRQMIETIHRRGGRHARYTEYPDGDHYIWEKLIGTPGLMDWLFAQKQQ